MNATKHRTSGRIPLLGLVGCVLLAPMVGADELDLRWNTVDGGGVMRSAAGQLELSGTIGQTDTKVMTGHSLTLSGGFWFEIPPGDCEDDGDVDLTDYDAFESCLTGPGGGPPATNCRCFDVNRSATIDLADFAIIQSTYTGTGL